MNKRLQTGLLKVHVVIVPLMRDRLFPALQAGKVDLVSASLTITPGREQLVDFCTPTKTNVSEIVVTAPGVPKVTTPDDLSGREVFVRKSRLHTRVDVRLCLRDIPYGQIDPNQWFGNAERVVSEKSGRETVTYVSNIYKYYVAYKLAVDRAERRQRAREAARQ